MDKMHANVFLTSCILYTLMIVQVSIGNPTYVEMIENNVEVPPMGTCRQECAGYNIGCPPGYVCCRTGCGHICQPQRCPKIKLTPYPFCLTHCPFQGVENKNLKSFCLCYNACMNVRCGKDEMCIPKQAKCEKETCLPLGVCVNVNKYTEHGILYLMKDKGIPSLNDAMSKDTFYVTQ